MLVTNHVLSGALIGTITRRPLAAFMLGVASHFVLDGMPHWGKWRDDHQFLQVAVVDGLTGLAAMAAFTAAAPTGRRAAVAAGMLGAALPDVDKPTKMWFGFSPWPRPVNKFHRWIQDEAPGRFSNELLSAVFFAGSATALLRAAPPHRNVPDDPIEQLVVAVQPGDDDRQWPRPRPGCEGCAVSRGG